MPSSLSIYPLFILMLVSALNGCADLNPPPAENIVPSQIEPLPQSTVNKLLEFGAGMSAMPETSRTDLCKSLLTTQQLLHSDEVQLQLMVGRLLSDACGDIPKILDDIQTINPRYESDEPLQQLIAIHTQALLHIHNQSKKSLAAKQKPKKPKPAAESKDLPEPKQNETHLLREKLEAIRSMEKQLDESVEGN